MDEKSQVLSSFPQFFLFNFLPAVTFPANVSQSQQNHLVLCPWYLFLYILIIIPFSVPLFHSILGVWGNFMMMSIASIDWRDDRQIAKDLERNNCGLIKILSWYLFGGTEEIHDERQQGSPAFHLC
jgi:hypothetical protein